MVEKGVAPINEPGNSTLSDMSNNERILLEIDGSEFPGDSRERRNCENTLK
jgi:hypothetical protein